MRSLKTLLPAAAAILVTILMSSTAQAGISGSKHDFGQFGWAKNEICLPCHVPHNAIVKDANGEVLQGPMWNHTLPASNVYKLYVDETTGQDVTGKVDSNSLLCLSCHDGSLAVDSFGGGAGTQQMTGGLIASNDQNLTNDHPIGAAGVYPTTDGQTSTASYMVSPSLRQAKGIMPLRHLDGKYVVGCTSCHEPHNRKNQDHMLWVKNSGTATTVDNRTVTGSVLCLNCHIK